MSYIHRTYGQARVVFQLEGVTFEISRGAEAPLSVFTDREITQEQYDRAVLLAIDLFEKFNEDLKRSLDLI